MEYTDIEDICEKTPFCKKYTKQIIIGIIITSLIIALVILVCGCFFYKKDKSDDSNNINDNNNNNNNNNNMMNNINILNTKLDRFIDYNKQQYIILENKIQSITKNNDINDDLNAIARDENSKTK